MNKNKSSFMAIGIPSVFTIFAVLCLVILSLLTLQTSRSDLRTSLLSMEQTSAYYEACQKATDLTLQTEDYARQTNKGAANQTDYFDRLAAVTEKIPEVSYDPVSHVFSFCIAFSEKQELYAELLAICPDTVSDSPLKILTWKTQTSGTWIPDTKQSVFPG